MKLLLCFVVAGICASSANAASDDATIMPVMTGTPWVVAHKPDLGELNGDDHQPVDFAIWQAGDGSWQIWSCIRGTKVGGKTRLFHRWEGKKITDSDWEPMGVAMKADPKYGEIEGGLQAPHVVRSDGSFYMLYGDFDRICLAKSASGKQFRRVDVSNGMPTLFTEAQNLNTRDPMTIRIGNEWRCYYTASNGSDYCRTSTDLLSWSEPKVVAFGGRAGSGKYSAECPFVVQHESGWFYLFRTQRYGEDAQTSVYRSKDPMDFGINDDSHFVCTLPIAAPEIVNDNGDYYIAYLRPALDGIQISKLEWQAKD